MSLGFFGLLRSGEFTFRSHEVYDPEWNLSRGSIRFHPDNSNPSLIELTIPASKTDPFRLGVTLAIGKATDPSVCPVRLLQQLFVRFPLQASSPLFSLLSGLPFSRSYPITKIRELLPAVGEDPDKYAGHSFRIGGATAAASLGYTEYEIQVLGRWRSLAYQRYLKVNLEKRAELTSGLSRTT
jgi:hypothetical protein